jgi:hypothetical protein
MDTSRFGDILALAKGILLLTASLIGGAAAVELMYVHPEAIAILVDRMQTVEVGNTKIAFGDMAFAINPDLKLSLAQQQKIRELAKSLSRNEFERLMHVTEYDKEHLSEDDLNCDYDNATSRMRLFAAADAGLIEKQLVERMRTTRLPAIRYDKIDKNAVDIGNPSNCYQMVLTDEGRNLKSAIVSELTRAFGNFSEDAVATMTTVEKTAATRKSSKEARSPVRGQTTASLP